MTTPATRSAFAAIAVAWLACGLTLLAPAVARAQPTAASTVRSLFVGVDQYAHGIDHNPYADPSFHDLRGAVNDVRLMQKTLHDTYGVATAAKDCDLGGAQSITLVDGCATRSNILAALERLISAAAPGDILLFYYAGHGSQHVDSGNQVSSQASQINSTIVPADAWRPPDADVGSLDIVDVELKAIIDEANRVGVSVVTIFDSCHSGTATRDLLGGLSRSAPPVRSAVAPNPMTWTAPQASAPASAAAYRVHMAAAGDDEIAYETSNGGVIDGVFTLALARALTQRKGATYRDIAQEVGWQLTQSGQAPNVALSANVCPPSETCANGSGGRQTSQEEGEITAAFLGARPDPARAYEADAAGPGASLVQIHGGTLSGVTEGSIYWVYASAQAARQAPDAPLAKGRVSAADTSSATLALFSPLPAPATVQTDAFLAATADKVLWAREHRHAYGPDRLKVAIDSDSSADAAAIQTALAPMSGEDGFFQIVADRGAAEFFITIACRQVVFQTRNQKAAPPNRAPKGQGAGGLGHPATPAGGCVSAGSDPAMTADAADPARSPFIWTGALADSRFADELAAAAAAVANFHALLGLRQNNVADWSCVQIVPAGATPPPCSAGGRASPARVRVDTGDVDMWVTNRTRGRRFFRYALFLDADTYEISIIDPPPNAEHEPAMDPDTDLRFFTGRYQRGGHGVVLVLTTEKEINVAALRQDPVRDIAAASGQELEKLLLKAAAGQREVGDESPGDYNVVAVDVTATERAAGTPETPSRPGPAGRPATPAEPPQTPVDQVPAGPTPVGQTPVGSPSDGGGRIVGGLPVDPGVAPYQVEVAWSDTDPPVWQTRQPRIKTAADDHRCGGSLIAKDWVLTAAHCVYVANSRPPRLIDPDQLVVRAGSVKLMDDGEIRLSPRMEVFPIARIIPHPDYRGSSDFSPPLNDLALLHLASPVPVDSPETPIKRFAVIALPTSPLEPSQVLATGWGSVVAATGVAQIQREQTGGLVPISPSLQGVMLNVVDPATCARQVTAEMETMPGGKARSLGAVPSSLLCAGYSTTAPPGSQKATCQGDSGGPLAALRKAPNRRDPVLVGVTGWAVGCAQAPGLYTRVSDFTGWIREVVSGRESAASAVP